MGKKITSFYSKYKGVSDTAKKINRIWEKHIRKASKEIRKLYKCAPIKEERQEIIKDIHKQGYKVFDLHIHTYISDGNESPQSVVDYAIDIGLDGIAITDHNAIRGGKLAQQYIKEKGYDLLLFPAEEISSCEGHIVAYWVEFPEKKIKAGLSAVDTCKKIHNMGGIAVAAHPFGPHGVSDPELLTTLFDALEINSRSTAGSDSLAKDFAEAHKIAYTGGSDAHLIQSIGCGCTITKHPVKRTSDLYELIINHKTDVLITPMWVEILTYLEELAEDYEEGLIQD